MSKSILVIDTPENCYNCGIRHGYSCGGIHSIFGIGKNINDFRLHKPDWCPLKAVQDKYEPVSMNFERGYNACIDEILKGANGNE